MQEIADGVYIEAGFPGVTLGAISQVHGQVLIDAPPRPEDVRSWRSALINLGGGVERLLVNLDAHYDRTIGTRAMECTILAHDRVAEVFRNRPTTFKAQPGESGAEWELISGLGSLRWAFPELTFSERLELHWGEMPIIVKYSPGPNFGSSWVEVPSARVVFVGDAVTPNQPPFLAHADIPSWLSSLERLLGEDYQDYMIVSGRGGLVPVEQVRSQIKFLQRVQNEVQALADERADAAATEKMIPGLLKMLEFPEYRRDQFTQRLRWGLTHYFTRVYRHADVEEEA